MVRIPRVPVNSPRIRGDGPAPAVSSKNPSAFSPYSRGWSRTRLWDAEAVKILPVFAGMVPCDGFIVDRVLNSPRIRGDGPAMKNTERNKGLFSPYSRGWSHFFRRLPTLCVILPVFAGMVHEKGKELGFVESFSPYSRGWSHQAGGAWKTSPDSPRIRGDGPPKGINDIIPKIFSPYSRGWSRKLPDTTILVAILPVFAGMVPFYSAKLKYDKNSPRIRGDGPRVQCPSTH